MTDYSMEELIPIVAELSEKYTSKESSSISYEKAQQLMEAVIYCIQECDTYKVSEGKTQYLNLTQNSAKEAYTQGCPLVLNKVKRVKEIYEKIIEDFQAYGNTSLKETVLKGIPGFLRYYDPKFAPQDHILTFDYPTLIDPLEQKGIDAVYAYICAISLEQDFLHAYPKEYVVSTLEDYHNDYEELFINLSSIVMRNLIGAMIARKPILQREFSISDYEAIHLWVKQKKECLEQSLEELLRLIIQKGYADNQEIYNYLKKDITNFSFELMNAYKNNCLPNIFGHN